MKIIKRVSLTESSGRDRLYTRPFTLINLIGFPHPWWMWVMAIAGIMPAAYLGVKTGMKKTIVP